MLRNLQVISLALTFGACFVFGVFAFLSSARGADGEPTAVGPIPFVLLALAVAFIFAGPVVAKAIAPRAPAASLEDYARTLLPSRIVRLAVREAAALLAGVSVFLGGELQFAAPIAALAVLAMVLDFPSVGRLTAEREALAGQRLAA
jgi:hypothetical protein